MSEGNTNGQMPGNTAVERHVSIGDAATILGVSIDTVRRWEKAGKLPAERLDGKNRYFAISHLEEFNANRPMSCTEVARLLKVSASTVRRLDTEGKLTAHRNEKGRRLYDRTTVLAYAARGKEETSPKTRSGGFVGSVIETMTEAATELDTALKSELETFREVEQSEVGSLMNANHHLPFSGWKIAFYLLVVSIGVFGLLTGVKVGPENTNILSKLNRAEQATTEVNPGSTDLQGFAVGHEPGDLAVLPITTTHLKDGGIESIDIASGAIGWDHISTDLQQRLGESRKVGGSGTINGSAGSQGPQGSQGISGPAGSPGTITDGDKGHITVSGSGSIWSINSSAIWQGSAVAVSYGGTGATSFTANGLIYGNGTGPLQSTAAGTAGQAILANASGIPTFTTISGDITVNSTGVTALKNIVGLTSGNYGSATQVPQVVVDTTGRITSVTNTTISGVTPGGPASGDLSGVYPNPSVVKINGNNLGSTTPTAGHLLLANGAQWATAAVSGDIALNGSGVTTIQSNAVALGGDTIGDYITNLGTLTGLTTTGNSGEGAAPTLTVSYGSTINTAVQGNTQITVAAGTGLSGGGSYTLGVGGSQTLNLANTSVGAASYGSASSVATFTVDAQGRLTAASASAIAINANQVTAGVLSAARGGTGVDASTAANGQLLIGNGTGLGLATLTAGIGVGISNGIGSITISSSAQANKGLEVDGNGLSLIDCASGEILKYSGLNQWVCATDTIGGVTDGDKGDVTVTSSGNSWSIDNGAVTNAKLQNSGINLLYSGNVSGDASVALGSTLNIGFSANPSFTSVSAVTFTGSLAGNASTATALNANPSDCAVDTYATTIAANGNLTCASITDAALSSNVTKLGATIDLATSEISGNLRASNLQAVAADLGAANLTVNLSNNNGSFNTNLVLDGSVTASGFIGALTGNASTATNLAADPTDCASNTFAQSIDNGGNLTCSAVNKTSLANSGILGFTWSDTEVSDTLTLSASSTVADGALSANVTKLGSAIDLSTSEISGQLRATNFQNSAADLGAANVDINLGNSNGSFNTNLTIDGVVTASSFSGTLSGNASTATALASNPTDCVSDTYATAIASSGNLTCTSITDAALSSNVTKLGATITKDELTGTGILGFTWADSEVADTLTIGASSTVADAALSSNVTKLGVSIQNAEVDDDLTISASGSVADGALTPNVTKLGSAIDLATSEVTGNLLATNLQSTAANLGAANVEVVLSNTNGAFVTNLTVDGSVTATTFSGALNGNATTATSLATNPSDCAADSFATIIANNGNLTCSTVGKTALASSGTLAFTWSDAEVSDTLTSSILVGSGSSSNAVDLATAEVAGNLKANNLQNAAADLGGADITVNLSNSNSTFNTNLTLDGTITTASNINTTAGALQLNGVDINTAGTLTNVAYENQANTFTAANSFTAAGTALSVTNNASIGGSLSVGSITIGTSGTPILKHLSGTATDLVSASIGAAACANYGTITVTGTAIGDTVYASPAAQAGGIETVNLDYMAIVTAANTVTIRACNPTLAAIDTANTQEWRADVWQH